MNGLTQKREIEFVFLDDIEVRKDRRAIDQGAVGHLAMSMDSLGLKTPISVRYYEKRPEFLPANEIQPDAIVLLTGAHRMEAAKRLGWEKIECFLYSDGDDIDAELWEISENLHRAELTALERDEQVARWIELTRAKQEVLSQIGTKPQGGRPEGGVRAAARDLGVARNDAHRAVKVASLSDDAKRAARDTGLADNRSVLLKAAKQETPEAQVHFLRTEFKKREEPKRTPPSDNDVVEKQFSRCVKAWDAACPDARQRFRDYININSVSGQTSKISG